MTDAGPRIVFMGTPEFAVASLRALAEMSYDIAAVVTVADKPAGRGRKLTFSPVKEYALNAGLRVLQPEKLRDTSFINTLSELKADIFVIVAFRMLPEEVWSLPALGTFNLHASLLPQYRGAAPINHAVMNGETVTGVTTFLIDREIDTGRILLSRATAIGTEETAGQVHDRLMQMGAALVIETVEGLAAKSLVPVPQVIASGTVLKSAPKIFPSDTFIDWNQSSRVVHNKIRGLSPHPGAVTILNTGGGAVTELNNAGSKGTTPNNTGGVVTEPRAGEGAVGTLRAGEGAVGTLRAGEGTVKLKLFGSKQRDDLNSEPGRITLMNKKQLFIACGTGSVEITELQPEGRKRMSADEFLRGYNVSGYTVS